MTAPSGGVFGALVDAVEAGAVPAAAAAAGRGDRVDVVVTRGSAYDSASGERRPVDRDTRFDLASLTKVLVTLPAVLDLMDRGVLHGGTELGEVLPWLPAPVGRSTVHALLTHTSGLPPRPARLPLPARAGSETSESAADVLRSCHVGAPGPVRYSDVGFVALGQLVAALATPSWPTSAVAAVTGSTAGWSFDGAGEGAVACTSAHRHEEAGCGQVHDELAGAIGGVAGHAGAFASLSAVITWCRRWTAARARGNPGLDGDLVAGSERCWTHSGGTGHRGWAWSCRGDRWDVLPAAWPDAAVSHTGFTGTSVALDPTTGGWVVILTNAVRVGRDKAGLVQARRTTHDRVAAAFGHTER